MGLKNYPELGKITRSTPWPYSDDLRAHRDIHNTGARTYGAVSIGGLSQRNVRALHRATMPLLGTHHAGSAHNRRRWPKATYTRTR